MNGAKKPLATESIADKAGKNSATSSFDYEKLQLVLAHRCYLCHGKQVQTKNVRLDSRALVSQHAQSIYQQVVASKIMPMNNATGITEAERLLVKQWFEAGAKKN